MEDENIQAQRLTDSEPNRTDTSYNQSDSTLPIQSYFNNQDAFYLLFAISFGPTFIALNLSITAKIDFWADFVLILIMALVMGLNFCSTHYLNKVHSITRSSNYQEIAYKASKENRGHVYLVSLLKATYLIATCAYSLQFCAVYFVSVVQQYWEPVTRQTTGRIWAVMFAFVLVYSAAAYFFYRKQNQLS